jgi:uncharacterized protein YbjT (DUF2867 family)
MQRITIFGATGKLGRPVALELARAGFQVTAMVRHPEAARQQLPDSIRLLPGDLRSPADIRAALQGADALYLNLSVLPASSPEAFQPEREGLAQAVAAARELGIRRIGYCSSLVQRYQGMNGFDWWVFRLKHEAVRLIRESGISYTLLYPSTFMDNFEVGSYRMGSRILLAGVSKHPMYFIAAEDFARQVRRSFELLQPGEHREYIIQGPEALTADEAAARFIAHYRKARLQTVRMPLGLMRALAPLSRTFSYGAHIIEALNEYPEAFGAEQAWAELGRPALTIEAYAAGLHA